MAPYYRNDRNCPSGGQYIPIPCFLFEKKNENGFASFAMSLCLPLLFSFYTFLCATCSAFNRSFRNISLYLEISLNISETFRNDYIYILLFFVTWHASQYAGCIHTHLYANTHSIWPLIFLTLSFSFSALSTFATAHTACLTFKRVALLPFSSQFSILFLFFLYSLAL